MKKILFAIVLFMTMLNIAHSEKMWAICKTYVNVREHATTKSDSIGRLYCGDSVQVDEVKNGWAHCTDLSFELSHGWVHTGYLTSDCPEYSNSEYKVIGNGRVALREKVNGKVREWAKPGTVLQVQWISSEWALTSKGYIKMKYLERMD